MGDDQRAVSRAAPGIRCCRRAMGRLRDAPGSGACAWSNSNVLFDRVTPRDSVTMRTGNRPDFRMTTLRQSPFKVSRIEDNPRAFGLRRDAVRACAEALYNRQSILISGERRIGN